MCDITLAGANHMKDRSDHFFFSFFLRMIDPRRGQNRDIGLENEMAHIYVAQMFKTVLYLGNRKTVILY